MGGAGNSVFGDWCCSLHESVNDSFYSSVRRFLMTGNSVRSKLTDKLVFVLFGALVMLLAACGGSSPNSTPSAPKATTLRMLEAPGQALNDLFNGYLDDNHGGAQGALGFLFEPL